MLPRSPPGYAGWNAPGFAAPGTAANGEAACAPGVTCRLVVALPADANAYRDDRASVAPPTGVHGGTASWKLMFEFRALL